MFDFDVVTGPTPPRGPDKEERADAAGRTGPLGGEPRPRGEGSPEKDGHRGR